MTDYLALLRQKKPAGATAQTAKSTLRGLCSSPIALQSPISSQITSSRWLFHLMDRDPVAWYLCPEVTDQYLTCCIAAPAIRRTAIA